MDSDKLNNKQVVTFSPTVGSIYKYELKDIEESVQEIGKVENKVKLTASGKAVISMEIVEKTEYGFNISAKFTSLKSETFTSGDLLKTVVEKDSTNTKDFESLKNLVFHLSREKEGIKVVSGYKEYSNKCAAAHEDPLSETYFSEIFEQILGVLPDQNISVGYSWRKEPLRKSGVEYMSNLFQLVRVDKNVAYVMTSAVLKKEVSAFNHSLWLDGKEQGDIEMEANTGMLLNWTKKTKLDGDTILGGINVSQSVVSALEIIGHRIK